MQGARISSGAFVGSTQSPYNRINTKRHEKSFLARRMTTIRNACEFLETRLPLSLAESWDNVGLLLGDRDASANRIMTCLTLTPSVCDEAISREANLVVTHHPLPFRPLKAITTDDTTGKLLWRLAGAGVSVFSPHTAFDSAATGINHQIAEALGLNSVRPIVPAETAEPGLGAGRHGLLNKPVSSFNFAASLKAVFETQIVRYAGPSIHQCAHVGIACGSGGSFLQAARQAGCDSLVTGEATFHSCLEAESLGIGLFLVGHYQSERFALENLALTLQAEFAGCEVWASKSEADPLIAL